MKARRVITSVLLTITPAALGALGMHDLAVSDSAENRPQSSACASALGRCAAMAQDGSTAGERITDPTDEFVLTEIAAPMVGGVVGAIAGLAVAGAIDIRRQPQAELVHKITYIDI